MNASRLLPEPQTMPTGPAHRPLRALLVEDVHPDAVTALEGRGWDVITRGGALTEDELVAALDGIDVLGIRSTTNVTDTVLARAPQLAAIGAFCIGTNQIDLPAATRRGIAVFNAPFSNTRSVVELAVAEIIALSRNLQAHSFALHESVWNKSAAGSYEVRGRTLGIVGYGNIGAQLSVVAEALGLRVVFYDIADKLALGNAHRCDSLSELLDLADIVTVHVDGRAANAKMFSNAQFSRMRPGTLFLNLARGMLVDLEALSRHLHSGHLAGAALDVFDDEPKAREAIFTCGLTGMLNVILTPHIAGSTQEAQRDIGRFVAGKLAGYLAAGDTELSVNLPSLAGPVGRTGSRLLHLHHNTPGVLAALESRLANFRVNIDAQLLGTVGPVGYAITDLAEELTRDQLDELGGTTPETIRFRALPAPTSRPSA